MKSQASKRFRNSRQGKTRKELKAFWKLAKEVLRKGIGGMHKTHK